MENKKTKIISIVAIVALALTVITATYAYFQAQTGDGSQTDIKINANTVDTFTFSTGSQLTLNLDQENFANGTGNVAGSTFASAKLTANNKTNSATANYYLYLIITGNTFTYTQNESTPEILMEVTDENGNKITDISSLTYKTVTDGQGNNISGYDITNKKGAFALFSNREITTTSSKTEKWNITVTFINYNVNQSVNAGKSFSAQILITSQDYENYTPTTINTLTTTRNGNNLTVNLSTTEGTSKIANYYYAIEETNSTTGMIQNKVQRLSNKSLAVNNLNFIQTSSSSYTFTNIVDGKSYKVYAYTTDAKNIKSNEYVYNYTANSYVLPTIDKLEVTGTTKDSMTLTLTATKGTNNISKYYYSIDGGNTFVESDSNIHTFNNLVNGLNYTIIAKVADTTNKYSNIFVYNRKLKLDFKLTLTNYTFAWNKIDGAASYQIYSDGKLLTTTSDTTAEIYGYYNEPGTYDITIKALDNTKKTLASTASVSYNLKKTTATLPTTNFFDLTNDPVSCIHYDLHQDENKKCGRVQFSQTGNGETFSSVTFNNSNYKINVVNFQEYLDSVNLDYKKEVNTLTFVYSEPMKTNFCSNSTLCTSFELVNLSITNSSAPSHVFSYKNSKFTLEHGSSVGIVDYALQLVEPGKIPSDWKLFGTHLCCLSSNTDVYIYDRKKKRFKKKKISDVDYDDELLCWDFDNGCFAIAKPIWIMKEKQTFKFNRLTFSDGSILETINQHRIFNVEKGMFTYPMTDDTPIGTTTLNANGEYVTLTKKEIIEEPIKYYNIMTNYHINLFANDILTSSRLSNIYPIKDLKYIYKQKRNNGYNLSIYEKSLVKGLRLNEQESEEIRLNEYVNNMLKNRK